MGIVSMDCVTIAVSAFDNTTSWCIMEEGVVKETGAISSRFGREKIDDIIDILFMRFPNATVLLEGESYKTPARLELEKAASEDYHNSKSQFGMQIRNRSY